MKHSLNLFLCLLCFSLTAVSQKIPKYDPKEFISKGWDINECNFDPEANALVLYKENTYDFVITPTKAYMNIKYKRAVKILNDEGTEHAELKYRFRSYRNLESVKMEKGIVYNKSENGKVTEQNISKENIFISKDNETYSTFKVAPPNIKAGSIIYYEYTVQTPTFKKHYYQESIPVVKSILNASFESDLKMILSNHIFQPFKKIETFKGDRKVYFIEMDSIISLSSEPYQHNIHLYTQKTNMIPVSYVDTRITPDMGQVLYNYISDDDFRRRMNSDIRNTETDAILAEATLKKTLLEKAELLYNYVKDNYELTSSGDVTLEKTLSQVVKQKKGTQAELAALLYRLLDKAELQPTFVITTTHDESPFELDWPSINDFSTLVVKVFINDKIYYLNPIYNYLSFGFVPRNILNNDGINISSIRSNKAAYAIENIASSSVSNITTANVIASISDEGKLAGDLMTYYNGYANIDFRHEIKEDSAKWLNEIKQTNGISITSDVIINRAADVSSSMSLKFEKTLSTQDEYLFQPINLFTDLTSNPFISIYRKTGVYFSTPFKKRVNMSINLGDKWDIESVPKSLRLVNEDKSINFTRRIEKVNNLLSIQLEIAVDKGLYTVEQYDSFYQFWKLMFEQLNETIAIKKK